MWPSARSVRGNVTVVLLTVVMVVIALGVLELAVGWLARESLL